MKRKRRRAFWHNIKFKYKITVVNENTLEEVAGLHVSKLNGLSVLLSACTVIFMAAAAIIVFTPLRNYLPGYMDSEVRQQVVVSALRADSLAAALERQRLYVMNLHDILSGEVKADTVRSLDSLTDVRSPALLERSVAEEEFRRRYEEAERYNLTAVADAGQAASLVFYRPIRGLVERPFRPSERHWGVDVAAASGENVMAVLDGTVVFASYTASWGYVVQIQHPQNFVSVYRYCGSLLKEEGDRVKGGEVVALAGRGTEADARPHLHFELWHKGNAVDPLNYVAF